MLFTLTVNVLADDIEEEEEKSFIQEIINASTGVENIPKLNSRACLILDRDSKKVVLENANLQESIQISQKAGGTGGSRLGLKRNDKITVKDLLYGLMLRSRK